MSTPSWKTLAHLGDFLAPSWDNLGGLRSVWRVSWDLLGRLGGRPGTTLGASRGNLTPEGCPGGVLVQHLICLQSVESFLDQFPITFLAAFCANLATILGADRLRKGSIWAQEGHHEVQKPKKLHLQNCRKPTVFECLWGLDAFQESLRKSTKKPPKP